MTGSRVRPTRRGARSPGSRPRACAGGADASSPRTRAPGCPRSRAPSVYAAGRSSSGACSDRTSPASLAAGASTIRPVSIHSLAMPMPTTRGRNQLLQPSGMMPRRVNTNPKRASVDASRTSIGSVMVAPIPTEAPFTAAMIGFFNAWMRSARMPPPSRGTSPPDFAVVGSNACAPPEMSAPAQNARPAR